MPCLLFHDQDSSTNDIVELFPAPVDPTQMTQARGKERSLKIASFTIITVKIWFLISSVSFYTCDLAQNPNTKRKTDHQIRTERWLKIYVDKVPRFRVWNPWVTKDEQQTCEPGCYPPRGRATSPKPPSQTFLSRASFSSQTYLGLFHLFCFFLLQLFPPLLTVLWVVLCALCSCVFNCLSLIWVFSLSCHFSCSVYFVFNCLLLLVLLCVFCFPILVFPCVFNLLPVLSTLHCTDNGAWQPWGQAPRHGQTCILSDFLRKTPKSNYEKRP